MGARGQKEIGDGHRNIFGDVSDVLRKLAPNPFFRPSRFHQSSRQPDSDPCGAQLRKRKQVAAPIRNEAHRRCTAGQVLFVSDPCDLSAVAQSSVRMSPDLADLSSTVSTFLAGFHVSTRFHVAALRPTIIAPKLYRCRERLWHRLRCHHAGTSSCALTMRESVVPWIMPLPTVSRQIYPGRKVTGRTVRSLEGVR